MGKAEGCKEGSEGGCIAARINTKPRLLSGAFSCIQEMVKPSFCPSL